MNARNAALSHHATLLLTAALQGCAPDAVDMDADDAGEEALRVATALPAPGGQGPLTPWGGADVGRWRAESVVANAASAELNRAFARRDVRDAWVAVPLRMATSDFRPYGDGQSNARPWFDAWTAPRPPVVATLLQLADGRRQVSLRFDRALPYGGTRFELRWGTNTLGFDATRDASGDWTATVPVPSSLAWRGVGTDAVGLVHPAGWNDWFPLTFRMLTTSATALAASVPAAQRTFPGGRSLPDPARVSSWRDSSETPFARLQRGALPAGYNAMPYVLGDVHGSFPGHPHAGPTAVGAGWAWVAAPPTAPVKHVYQCFARRDAAAEARDGVPSGGGWHQIGDAAESIVHSLEREPFLVGYAMASPLAASALPSGAWSYGLSDVAVVRLLRPGEAMVTARGEAGRPAFHWFAFHHAREVCAEVWVHPCRPPAGEASFRCE